MHPPTTTTTHTTDPVTGPSNTAGRDICDTASCDIRNSASRDSAGLDDPSGDTPWSPGPSNSLHEVDDDPGPGPSRRYRPTGPSRVTSPGKLDNIAGILPNVPVAQVKFLLEVLHDDADAVTSVLVEGVTLSLLVKSLKSCYLDECSVKRIFIDECDMSDPARLAEEAVVFYKGSGFSPHAEVRISIEDHPVVDAGGVRRQFMSDVFSHFTTSQSMRLFEGPKNRLRPCFRQSSISMLTLVGKMVGHSVIMDGVGFPFFSPACYYYMAGFVDRAISAASVEDTGERVRQLVELVSNGML